LFAGLDDDDSVRNKINSQDIRTEAPEMPIHEDYYTEATLVPSRKYRGEFVKKCKSRNTILSRDVT
jgi:hypothetical protein